MDINLIARSATESLLNSLPSGIAITLIAWALARAVRNVGARVRFAVWLVALASIPFLIRDGSPVSASSRVLPSLASGAVVLPAAFASYLFIFWVLGACFGLARVVVSLNRLRRLRASCSPVEPSKLDPVLQAEVSRIQRLRRVSLCVSEVVRVPAALGYFRPLVVFPTWALSEMPADQLCAILMHELAHLRRYDDWTNLGQKLLKALLFFHPAVWFIESQLTLEREMACDDAVLAADFAPRAYAESLVNLAERSFLHRGVQLAQAAVGRVQQLKLRLAEILRKDRAGQTSSRPGRVALAVMAVVLAIAVYGSTRVPRLIAFSGSFAPAASLAATRVPQYMPLIQLQPTNLRYGELGASTHLQAGVGTRLVQPIAPKPLSSVAQNGKDGQVERGESRLPAAVLANYPRELSDSPVLVLLHGEQVGRDGRIVWRIVVLHLTQAQQQVLSGGLQNKI